MLTPRELATRQGLAYVVAAHGVLQKHTARTKCPAALLHTLLALHTVNEDSPALPASTGQLHEVMRIQLPLLRAYLRELTSRGYVKRERFFRRGPQLLKLTASGQAVARDCQRDLRHAAGQVLESRGLG